MGVVLASLASVAAVSLVSLVGLVTLTIDEARNRKLATLFVSFAVGALLGDAFIHLIPDAFAAAAVAGSQLGASLLVLAGMLVFFVVEKLLRHNHGVLHAYFHGSASPRPELAAINIFGDALHNFIDGALIGASYLAGPTVGVTTTIAVLLHEIPQELGDFAVLLHSGLSVKRAIALNFASAVTAIFGTALALLAGDLARQGVVDTLLPMTAGGFVYLAAADLIPELQHDRTLAALVVQTALIASGMALMGWLTLVG